MTATLTVDNARWLTSITYDVSSYVDDGIASGIANATSLRSATMKHQRSCIEHMIQTDNTELATLTRNIATLATMPGQLFGIDSVITYTVNVPKYLRVAADPSSEALIDAFNVRNNTIKRLLRCMANEIASTLGRKTVVCNKSVDLRELISNIVEDHLTVIQQLAVVDEPLLDLIRQRITNEYQKIHS